MQSIKKMQHCHLLSNALSTFDWQNYFRRPCLIIISSINTHDRIRCKHDRSSHRGPRTDGIRRDNWSDLWPAPAPSVQSQCRGAESTPRRSQSALRSARARAPPCFGHVTRLRRWWKFLREAQKDPKTTRKLGVKVDYNATYRVQTRPPDTGKRWVRDSLLIGGCIVSYRSRRAFKSSRDDDSSASSSS